MVAAYINALPDSVAVDDEAAIAAARAAYDALLPESKALVNEGCVAKLNSAEVGLVTAYIDALPETVTVDDEAAVAAARAAYDALSDTAKAQVDVACGDKLANAEAAIAAAKDTQPPGQEDDQDSDKKPPVVIKQGTSVTAGSGATKAVYLVKNTAKRTVVYKKAKLAKGAKKATVPTTVKLANGKSYKVVSIAKNAFKGTKVTQVTVGKNVAQMATGAFNGAKKLTKLVVKTAKLKKKTIKGCFKGSKVKTVKAPKAKKSAYKKIFTKKVTKTKAKKLTVK